MTTPGNYTNAVYTATIRVTKSPEDVFHYITHDVQKFWPEQVEGDCTKPHDEFVFRSGDTHYSKNKVVEFVSNKRIVWLVTDSLRKADNYQWTGTKMIFDLTPEDHGTRIDFTYDGVVFQDESDRLAQVCDFVIKQNLYTLIESFSFAIDIPKSSQVVFNCLREVPKWWSKDFEGNCRELNDEFVIHHAHTHFSKQKLIQVIPNKKIVWRVTESTLTWLRLDQQEWTNTKMIFDIREIGDKTLLHFTHEGLLPEKECYARCERGWTSVIKEGLFNFIVSGKSI